MLSRRDLVLASGAALMGSIADAATYSGLMGVVKTVNESDFLPVTVPNDFVGLHNPSFGTGLPVSHPASAHVSALDGDGQPVVVIDDPGHGYYLADPSFPNGYKITSAVVFSGGDATRQATAYANVRPSDGAITGVTLTSRGDYKSAADLKVAILTVGGPNIPEVPFRVGSYRTHGYHGSFTAPNSIYGIRNTWWSFIDPGDGSTNAYNWAALDEAVCYYKAVGATVMFNLRGTPAGFADGTSSALHDVAGSNCPLTGSPSGPTLGYLGLQNFINALMLRYNTDNSAGLRNPVTGQKYPSNTKFIDYLEFWNEPVFGIGGAAQPGVAGTEFAGTAQNLVDMTRIVYRAAKSHANPPTIVGMGFLRGDTFDAVDGKVTDANHNAYVFLSAVDSVEGKPGWRWLEEISFHIYDGMNKASPWEIPPHTLNVEQKIARLRRLIKTVTGGATMPISITEMGVSNAPWQFFTSLSEEERGIYFKRQFAIIAAAGIKRAYFYSFSSAFGGWASNSAPIIAALTETANILPGKSITGLARAVDGSLELTFADGSTWWTR